MIINRSGAFTKWGVKPIHRTRKEVNEKTWRAESGFAVLDIAGNLIRIRNMNKDSLAQTDRQNLNPLTNLKFYNWSTEACPRLNSANSLSFAKFVSKKEVHLQKGLTLTPAGEVPVEIFVLDYLPYASCYKKELVFSGRRIADKGKRLYGGRHRAEDETQLEIYHRSFWVSLTGRERNTLWCARVSS